MDPLIISVAVTGGEHGRETTPYLPLSPEEIAKSAYEAHKAGAAIVHVHVRDEEGRPVHDLERYGFVKAYLRERCDILLNFTTDPGGDTTLEQRPLSLEAGPDLASFDAGTLLAPVGERIVFGGLSFLRTLAIRMREANVKPELEIFHSGMVGNCLVLAEEGLLEEPLYFQFVLGVPGNSPATARELLNLVDQIPSGSPWSVTGIGRHGLEMAMLGISLGGHVRVGLEDQIYYSRGVLATTNAELVARVVRIATDFGRPIATPTEAHQILGLAAVSAGS